MGDHVEVLDVGDLLSEGGELVEVGGEEDRSASFGSEVSGDGGDAGAETEGGRKRSARYFRHEQNEDSL